MCQGSCRLVPNEPRGARSSMTMEYPEVVKARMVRRMTGPDAMTASALAVETGMSQPTLSRWLREAGSVVAVSKSKRPRSEPSNRPMTPTPEAEISASRRPQDYSPLERARVVLQASELGEQGLGEYLRRRGLHRELLDQWREALEAALAATPRRQRSESQRIRELEREVARKDKALAEAAALIVLKKKAALLFGEDEDDDTNKKSGR
jgi:transposase